MSSLKELQRRAIQIANHYDEYNRAVKHEGWDFQDYVSGLVGDVGDLMKLAMAAQNKRDDGDLDVKIEHELNDVLWSVLVLFYIYNRIDPEKSFLRAMDELESRVVKMKEQLA